MSKKVVKAQYLSLGGVDRSALTKGITLTLTSDAQDATNNGSAGWKEFLAGLKSATLAIDWVLDADLSVIDDDLWTAFNAGTPLTFEVREENAAVDATNPKYTGSLIVTQFSPISGSVGQVYGGNTSWTVTGAVTRATA